MGERSPAWKASYSGGGPQTAYGMMILQVEQYHGVALARLVRAGSPSEIRLRVHSAVGAAYVLEDRIAPYVKHSTSRMSPWMFTFSSGHRKEVAMLHDEFSDLFIVLVCGGDGIACLGESEYRRALSEDKNAGGEHVRINYAWSPAKVFS